MKMQDRRAVPLVIIGGLVAGGLAGGGVAWGWYPPIVGVALAAVVGFVVGRLVYQARRRAP
jgi:hypothetical protein